MWSNYKEKMTVGMAPKESGTRYLSYTEHYIRMKSQNKLWERRIIAHTITFNGILKGA
jgi:hypothetical protein